jgi:hypothetical protein
MPSASPPQAVLSAFTEDRPGSVRPTPTAMPIPNLPPLGSTRPTYPSSLARFQQDLDLPVPNVASDPTDLIARALHILAEETDAWHKRRVTNLPRIKRP